MRVLLIGNTSGRLDCIAEAVTRSRNAQLFILTNYTNASLHQKGLVTVGPTADPDFVSHWAELLHNQTTMAIISNEEPLAAGVVDRLLAMGIPAVGPTKALARIESSKIYARDLMERYQIPVNPLWGFYTPENSDAVLNDALSYMKALGEFVIKPDGLTGGKGVLVMGDHFHTISEAYGHCIKMRNNGIGFIIEEKLYGEEFSLMSFFGDGGVHTYPIQDHKRLRNGDSGPNTGGMGSYARSTGVHSVPFVNHPALMQAARYNEATIKALNDDTGEKYRGILYGNYIVTAKGVKLIEYNARFADPEGMNLLPLMENDPVDLFWAIANGNVKPEMLQFAKKASVCKYLVPASYGTTDEHIPEKIDLSQVERNDGLRIYYGGVDVDTTTGSRAVAMVGIADTLAEAEQIAETACQQAGGTLYHRTDIGTAELLKSRLDRFCSILVDKYPHENS